MYCRRMSMINPWDTPEFPLPFNIYDYPGANNLSWETMTLAQFYERRDELPIRVPVIEHGCYTPYLNLGLGPYWYVFVVLQTCTKSPTILPFFSLRRSSHYITLTRMRELLSQLGSYNNFSEYLADCQSLPLGLTLKIRYFDGIIGNEYIIHTVVSGLECTRLSSF